MKKYNSIDLIKFIMAIFVIAIHTEFLVESDHPVYSLLIRSAVPFYFMCLGFLLMNKINNDKNNNEIVCIKDYIKKILKLYVIWSIIYIPITIYNFVTTSHDNTVLSIIGIFKNYIFVGQQFYSWPLWYLLCTLYSLLLILLLKRFKLNNKIIFIISVILFIIGSVYTSMISNINDYSGIVLRILNLLNHVIGSSGRILQGMLYINIGIIFSNNYNSIITKIKIYYYIFLLIVIFILNILFDFELLKVIFNISVFLIVISTNIKDNKIYYYLRKSGVIIYFTHMIIFFIYSLCVGFDNSKGTIGFIVCLISTLVLSIIINFINRKRNIKILNTIFN